jgi:RNA polymerase sigma-70 factor (sigma-E family)
MEFEDYVAARGQALLRLAYVLTGDQHTAEDLTQAALLDALRHWRRICRASHPDAYIRRVMVNRNLARRRTRASSELVLDDVGPLSKVFAPDPALAVADRDQVFRALAGLAPRARTVLVLRYYADLDDAAIADCLGLAPGTVRATASRALATLRACLSAPPLPEETR